MSMCNFKIKTCLDLSEIIRVTTY